MSLSCTLCASLCLSSLNPLPPSLSVFHPFLLLLNLSFSLSPSLSFTLSFSVCRWIVLSTITPLTLPITKLSRCNEQYCLLTTKRIEHAQDSIRCGRCSGVFHIDSLHILGASSATSHAHAVYSSNQLESFREQFKSMSSFIVLPSKELLEPGSHDEWFCPLCLQEDTHTQSQRYVLVIVFISLFAEK